MKLNIILLFTTIILIIYYCYKKFNEMGGGAEGFREGTKSACEAATGGTCTNALCGSCAGRGWANSAKGQWCGQGKVWPKDGNQGASLSCGWPSQFVQAYSGGGAAKKKESGPSPEKIQTETTNDFWKGASACGCDWTQKHSPSNFDNDNVRKGNFKWCHGTQAAAGTQCANDKDPLACCARNCKAKGYCCNDVNTGSNQFLSCSQGCMMSIKNKFDNTTCKNKCKSQAGKRGCSYSDGKVNFSMCSSCKDLTNDPKCAHGTGAGKSCSAGCDIAGNISSAKSNCENKTKFSMCKLNSKGHCVTRFQFQKNSPPGFTNKSIRTKSSKLCLEAPTTGQITEKICTGKANQQFSYDPKTYELKSRAGYCVDVAGGSRADSVVVQTVSCKQNTNNQFNQRFYQVGNTFKPMHVFQKIPNKPQDNNSGKCLTLLASSNLIQYKCHGGANQQFDIIDPEKVIQSFSEPHPGDTLMGFNGMLNAQKYKGYWADNLNFFNTAPKIGNVKQLKSIHLLDEGAYYSYKIWGFFSPPKTGKYYFKTNSDDSSVVYIDKTKVVDNGQLHPMRARTGTIDLQKGKIYPIYIYFGEKNGYAELYFSWSSGQGWTNSLDKFYSSKTYDDVPCVANFTGQQYKISKWGITHQNGTEELHVKFGDSELKFNISNKDIDKIKGAVEIMVYPKQPPGGTFFADPIKTRNVDFYGNLTLKTHMNTEGITISNNNRKCFNNASHIYVGTKLPEPPANCNKQILYSGQYMCVECKPGYQLSQNKRNCNLIPIENCKEQNGLECKKCHDGSFLAENRRKCIKAAPPPPKPPSLEKKAPVGVPGLRGQMGLLGERGVRGLIGKRGPKGKDAPKRSSYNKGPKGRKGVVGPKGPKGLKGIAGLLGKRGILGYQGKATVFDPWSDPKIVSKLMVIQDKLKDENKKLEYTLDSDRKPVNLKINMPRNRKKAVFKRFLVEADDTPSDDIKKIEQMTTYPPGRGPENLPNTLNGLNPF